MTSYTTTLTVNATPEQVFDAITDVRGWWGTNIAGDALRVGDEFNHHVEGVHDSRIRVDELDRGRKVVWTVLDNSFSFLEDKGEWVGNTIVFDIAPVDGGSRLTFTQHGLVPEYECYELCQAAWTFYVTESLHDLVATGVGQPTRFDDPEVLRDIQASVGVGVAYETT